MTASGLVNRQVNVDIFFFSGMGVQLRRPVDGRRVLFDPNFTESEGRFQRRSTRAPPIMGMVGEMLPVDIALATALSRHSLVKVTRPRHLASEKGVRSCRGWPRQPSAAAPGVRRGVSAGTHRCSLNPLRTSTFRNKLVSKCAITSKGTLNDSRAR